MNVAGTTPLVVHKFEDSIQCPKFSGQIKDNERFLMSHLLTLLLFFAADCPIISFFLISDDCTVNQVQNKGGKMDGSGPKTRPLFKTFGLYVLGKWKYSLSYVSRSIQW